MTETGDHLTHHGCYAINNGSKPNAKYALNSHTVLNEDDDYDHHNDDDGQGMHQKLAAFYIHFVLISRSSR